MLEFFRFLHLLTKKILNKKIYENLKLCNSNKLSRILRATVVEPHVFTEINCKYNTSANCRNDFAFNYLFLCGRYGEEYFEGEIQPVILMRCEKNLY